MENFRKRSSQSKHGKGSYSERDQRRYCINETRIEWKRKRSDLLEDKNILLGTKNMLLKEKATRLSKR